MSENKIMLQAENITKAFNNVPVLKGVSLTVRQGETLAIIGQSGSGKSTLLRCLNHLEKVDSGKIVIDGEVLVDEKGYPDEKTIQKICLKSGCVFQSYNLFPHFNVLRNLTEAQQCVLKRSKQEAENYGRQLLAKVGLSDKEKAYPCELSGGQCQRVAIARALAMDPELLFFDEPTSALDPQLTKEVLQVIRALSKEKRTIVVVTHEMNFARDVADRIIYMENGIIAAKGTPDEVFQNEQVRRFSGTLAN